jgi:hypothetical protein
MSKYKIYSILFLFIIFAGCRKNETGGKGQISGFVVYNGFRVPASVVYIKYGATQSPGTDPIDYDSQQTADSQGNFVFGSMFEGDYYLYTIGNYSTVYGFQKVTGGVHAIIPHQKSSVNFDIATTK